MERPWAELFVADMQNIGVNISIKLANWEEYCNHDVWVWGGFPW